MAEEMVWGQKSGWTRLLAQAEEMCGYSGNKSWVFQENLEGMGAIREVVDVKAGDEEETESQPSSMQVSYWTEGSQLIALIHSREGKRWISRRKGKSGPKDGRQRQRSARRVSRWVVLCYRQRPPSLPAIGSVVCRGFTIVMYVLHSIGEIRPQTDQLSVLALHRRLSSLHWLYCLF